MFAFSLVGDNDEEEDGGSSSAAVNQELDCDWDAAPMRDGPFLSTFSILSDLIITFRYFILENGLLALFSSKVRQSRTHSNLLILFISNYLSYTRNLHTIDDCLSPPLVLPPPLSDT